MNDLIRHILNSKLCRLYKTRGLTFIHFVVVTSDQSKVNRQKISLIQVLYFQMNRLFITFISCRRVSFRRSMVINEV